MKSPIMTFEELFEKIDFKELSKQKAILLQAYGEDSTVGGIITLIDAIQDSAADGYGYPEGVVYGEMDAAGALPEEAANSGSGSEGYSPILREKTTEEIREEFLSRVIGLIDELARERGIHVREVLSSLVFRIFCARVGCMGGLPGFVIAPVSSVAGRESLMAAGEHYYPVNPVDGIRGDIGGELHSVFMEMVATRKGKING